jgi:DNA-binding response OmpR family regulator
MLNTTHPQAVGKTILIADDDPKLRAALSKRLQAIGFKVIESQDAYMATDAARHHTPDLIILDINMPAGCGDSTHERLKKIPETATIPIIYLTGETSDHVRKRARELGAKAIIRKPYDIVDLVARIFEATKKQAA